MTCETYNYPAQCLSLFPLYSPGKCRIFGQPYRHWVGPHHPLQPLSPSSGVLWNFPEGGRLEKQSDLSVESTIYSTNSEVRLWCQSQLRLFMLILSLTHWTVESVVDKSTLEVLNNLGSIYFPSTFIAIHKMSRHIFSLFSERLNEDLPQVPVELEPGSNVLVLAAPRRNHLY